MSIIEGISKLTDRHSLVFASILSLCIPGLGSILIFQPDLLIKLDIFKIVFFVLVHGICLLLPSWLVAIASTPSKLQKMRNGMTVGLIALVLMCVLVCILVQTVYYFFLAQFGLNLYLLLLVILFMAVMPILTVIINTKLLVETRESDKS